MKNARPRKLKEKVLHPDKPDFVPRRFPGGWMAIPLTPAVKRAPLAGARCDNPGLSRTGVRGQAGGLFSLFVLHRAGFVLPPALRRGAVGS